VQEHRLARKVKQQGQADAAHPSAQRCVEDRHLVIEEDAGRSKTGLSGGIRCASTTGLSPGKIVFIGTIPAGKGLL
jgi:hypothetical protein